NRTIIRNYARANGITDTSWLGLAYHIRGHELGDTIEVINKKDGTSLYTVFGFYFGREFGRLALQSRSGQQTRRIEYVYTGQNSHSLGSAVLTNYHFFDGHGNVTNTVVRGQMQYLVLGDTVFTNVQVCTASIKTLRPWKFQ
ncbi:MAG TPA: hypothetical protein VEC99_07880, partial [Clostridia bacterium]|nr:hypothetical protein [Clostridia bacterium]